MSFFSRFVPKLETERAEIWDNGMVFYHEEVDFFLNNPDYRFVGYRRVGGVIWHRFIFTP